MKSNKAQLKSVEEQQNMIAALNNTEDVEILGVTVERQGQKIQEINDSRRRDEEQLVHLALTTADVVGNLSTIDKAVKSLAKDVHFTVRLATDTLVNIGDTVKFDTVITNVGGGYIDNSSHADYGKFIAPISGTYQFLLTIMNSDMNHNPLLKADVLVNNVFKVNMQVKDEKQSGTCHLVQKLNEGDDISVGSVSYSNCYEYLYTSFSGYLIRADNV